jgi:hypothetical protein
LVVGGKSANANESFMAPATDQLGQGMLQGGQQAASMVPLQGNVSQQYQPEVLKVFTKKMNKIQYCLASFNEPLTQDGIQNLPAHVIEQPVEAEADSRSQFTDGGREQYANVHHMVK